MYKILISAYACSPYHGSEPGMGWNFIKSLSSYHNIHVITEKNEFKNDIESYIAYNPEYKKIKFYYIPRKHHEQLRKIWPPSYYWFYRKWQKKVYKLALALDGKENFDIVHQLNMVGFREPGYLWKMKRPFVWGPIGGMENTSLNLLFNLNIRNFIFYGIRNVINLLQLCCLKRAKLAAKRNNSALISATPGIQKKIKMYWDKASYIIPEVGQQKVIDMPLIKRYYNEPLRIVWSGQHTGGKALNILIKCLAQFPERINWKLTILGTGIMTRKWKKMAVDYNIDQHCDWCGWLKTEDAHRKMQESHLLCITSIMDLTSTVTLEGLSFGLPVICIDHCGFSYVVNDSCGIKIPVDYPGNLIKNFENAITKLHDNEVYRQVLSKGAFHRAKHFSWEGKIKQLNEIYYALVK